MSLQRMHGVSLFFFHTPSPSSPALNAPRLYGETHFARVGGKKRGGEKARCGRMLCKQRVQHAIPSPSPPPPCRKTGHRPFRGNNSSAGTFMRAGARLLPSPPPSSSAIFSASPCQPSTLRCLEKCFIAPIFPDSMRNDPPRHISRPSLAASSVARLSRFWL